eukprot:1251291-Amorphochlora_amoeboformis.AAC.1
MAKRKPKKKNGDIESAEEKAKVLEMQLESLRHRLGKKRDSGWRGRQGRRRREREIIGGERGRERGEEVE